MPDNRRFIYVGQETLYSWTEMLEDDFNKEEKALIDQLKVGEQCNCMDGIQIKRLE